MRRLSQLTLIFGIIFALLILSPAFLSSQFGPAPLLKVGDVTDIFTPIILFPLYWLLFRIDNDKPFSWQEVLTFMVFAALWAEGQGMHLSANATGHLLDDMKNTDVYQLNHFFDEVLGHYLWHIGVLGLSAVLLRRQWRNPFTERSNLRLESIGGLIYGATYFLMTVEAGTVPIGLPFALIVSLFGLTTGRKQLRQQPILMFFLVAHVFALICYIAWGVYWRGFPQFSEVGLLK